MPYEVRDKLDKPTPSSLGKMRMMRWYGGMSTSVFLPACVMKLFDADDDATKFK